MKDERTLEEKKLDRQWDITQMEILRAGIKDNREIIERAQRRLSVFEEEHSRLVMKLVGDL